MTTSVDALFRKPREGTFIKEEEFSQIQQDLHYLMQENKKLTSMIHQYQNPPPVIPAPTPVPTPIPTPVPVPVAHQNVSSTPMIYYSHDAQPVSVPEHGKTITIVIDTNKMVYLLLFIILVIMILKK